MIIIDKNTIAEYLSDYLPNFSQQEIKDLIEIPPQDLNYSYAFPCFQLAKIKKKSRRTLYIFISKAGNVTGANYTGK